MFRVIQIFLVALFFIVGGSSWVQAGTSDKKMGSHCPVEKMGKDLNLNADQKTQFEAIMNEALQKKEQILQEKHSKMEALCADVKAKVAKVLSADQLKAWEAKSDHCPIMRGEKSSRHGNRGYVSGCPDCQDGKKCEMCKGKKGCKEGKCPDCLDGKKCSKCQAKK